MRIEVRTQTELDAALAAHRDDPFADIAILSPAGVWLEISDTGRAYVRATNSATVMAYGSATVRAYDSATVMAYDSATVMATGSATVTATKYVAVHLHSAHVTVSGGVVIDVTSIDQADPTEWAEYVGAQLDGDYVLLYKAVDVNLAAGHSYKPTTYPIGGTVTAADWKPTSYCGHGLHASPWPEQALAYAESATRMLVVSCPLADLRPIPGSPAKAKAQTFRVLREVNLDGSEIA